MERLQKIVEKRNKKVMIKKIGIVGIGTKGAVNEKDWD